jgi:hypothetical protein
MMSHNLFVVELSSEILFYFSMPSFSLASFTDDQAKDPSATQVSLFSRRSKINCCSSPHQLQKQLESFSSRSAISLLPMV